MVISEPDTSKRPSPASRTGCIRIIGVDVFDPQTGGIRSGDTQSIAAGSSTPTTRGKFLCAPRLLPWRNDRYKSLKAALRADIDEEAWATLYRDVSRPFARPTAAGLQ